MLYTVVYVTPAVFAWVTVVPVQRETVCFVEVITGKTRRQKLTALVKVSLKRWNYQKKKSQEDSSQMI